MANKKLLYNENGTNAEIPNSGSLPAVYFDDVTNTLVAQGLVINKVTASIGSTNGILGTDSTGKLTTISTASATSGQYLQSDGTNWAFRDASGVATGNYLPDSDLSGSLSAPTVISIKNVVSGTLSASYGGTGVSSFTSGGLLVKDSTSTLKFVRPDAGASVLRPDGNGSWYSGGATATGSYTVSASYYTASVNSYSWNKPSTHKNVKVILMACGGGGAGGRLGTVSALPRGGGAGGFSVYDIVETENLTATITVGTGGLGGVPAVVPNSNGSPGGTGGNAIFSSSNGHYFVSSGGTGGSQTSTTILSNRGYGNISITLAAAGASGFGGYGGHGSSVTGDAGDAGNTSYLLSNLTASGGSAGTNGPSGVPGTPGSTGSAIKISYGAKEYYAAFGGGGGGGGGSGTGTGGNGGNGISGSGGGGGGATPTGTGGNGGNGGDGYVIVISW